MTLYQLGMEKIIIELIDTLWNVNFCEVPITNTLDKELIDTLWNVNLFRSSD